VTRDERNVITLMRARLMSELRRAGAVRQERLLREIDLLQKLLDGQLYGGDCVNCGAPHPNGGLYCSESCERGR
jgi:hypothetical protein